MTTVTRTATVQLNDWELAALETILEEFMAQRAITDDRTPFAMSIRALYEKIHSQVTK